MSKKLLASSKYVKSGSDDGSAKILKQPTAEKNLSVAGTDVRLPPFVRTQLDLIRDAETAEGLKTCYCLSIL